MSARVRGQRVVSCWPAVSCRRMQRRRTGRIRRGGDTVGAQDVTDIHDHGEDFVVAVLALLVPGPLLGLDRHPVLGEYALGEAPDDRPSQLDSPRDRRLLDHEQAVDVIGPLLGIFRYVGDPQGKRRKLGFLGDQLEGLVGVGGADGNNVGCCGAADAFRGEQASAYPVHEAYGQRRVPRTAPTARSSMLHDPDYMRCMRTKPELTDLCAATRASAAGAFWAGSRIMRVAADVSPAQQGTE